MMKLQIILDVLKYNKYMIAAMNIYLQPTSSEFKVL